MLTDRLHSTPSVLFSWTIWHQEEMILDGDEGVQTGTNVRLALQERRCIFINSINLSARSYNALRGILSVADASQMLVQTVLSSLLNNTRLTLCLKYSLGRPLDELLPLGLMGLYPPSCPCPLFPTYHQDTLLPISYSCVVLHLLCRMALWGL